MIYVHCNKNPNSIYKHHLFHVSLQIWDSNLNVHNYKYGKDKAKFLQSIKDKTKAQ